MRNAVLTPGTTLQQGVAIFPAHSVLVSPSYLNLVQTKLGGTVQSVAYTAASEAVHTINSWALEQTGDQLKSFVSEVDPQTQLLLAATSSYKGTCHLSGGGGAYMVSDAVPVCNVTCWGGSVNTGNICSDGDESLFTLQSVMCMTSHGHVYDITLPDARQLTINDQHGGAEFAL